MRETLNKAAKFYALAADLEDDLLRFRGNQDDAETVRNVIGDLLHVGDSILRGDAAE